MAAPAAKVQTVSDGLRHSRRRVPQDGAVEADTVWTLRASGAPARRRWGVRAFTTRVVGEWNTVQGWTVNEMPSTLGRFRLLDLICAAVIHPIPGPASASVVKSAVHDLLP
jgi:hypothetical protein